MKPCQIGLLLILSAALPVVAVGQSSEQPSSVGRYSLTTSADGLYFLDTATGELWLQPDGNRAWSRVDSPVSKRPAAEGDGSDGSVIPEGFRLVTVKVDDAPAHLDAIRPRDMVDVYVTYEVTDADGKQTMKTKMILAQIQVFVIGKDRDNPVDEVRNISLLVTPKQAAILMLADQKGDIRVVLRAKVDE